MLKKKDTTFPFHHLFLRSFSTFVYLFFPKKKTHNEVYVSLYRFFLFYVTKTFTRRYTTNLFFIAESNPHTHTHFLPLLRREGGVIMELINASLDIIQKKKQRYTEPVLLDSSTLNKCITTSRSDPLILNSMENLLSEVFSVEPEVYIGNKLITPGEEFTKVINIMRIACKDCLRCIMIAGVAPIAIVEDEKTNTKKVICTNFMYRMFATFDTKHHKMKFFIDDDNNNSRGICLTNDTRTIKRKIEHGVHGIHVLSSFGFDPDPNGRINSIMASLLPTLEHARVLRELHLEASIRAVKPDLVTEVPTDPNDGDSTLRNVLYAEDLGSADENRVIKRYRTDQDVFGFKQNNKLFAQVHKHGSAALTEDLTSAPISLESYVTMHGDVLMQLPAGHKLAHQIVSQAPKELLHIQEMARNMVCALFESGTISSNRTEDRTTEGVLSSARRRSKKVTEHRTIASQIMDSIFAICYVKERAQMIHHLALKLNSSDAADIENGEKKPPTKTTDESMIDDLISKTDIRFAFPDSNPIDEENLITAWYLDAVTDDEMRRSMRILAGFSDSGQMLPVPKWLTLMKQHAFQDGVQGILAKKKIHIPDENAKKREIDDYSDSEKKEIRKKRRDAPEKGKD